MQKTLFTLNYKYRFFKLLSSSVLFLTPDHVLHFVWLGGVVVSALGARGPGFDSRVAPLFHWVATLGKLFTHVASPVSQLQETGVQKGVFGAYIYIFIHHKW